MHTARLLTLRGVPSSAIEGMQSSAILGGTVLCHAWGCHHGGDAILCLRMDPPAKDSTPSAKDGTPPHGQNDTHL